ncbi:excinuclease ABC subunit UvrA [Paenibacillus tarimensis]|uniref:excinuclease ABC subunit UvrA n=1 Tax=Paenibacillus tarimensis TaxID=416012 RepID=UPI001F3E5725|nr:excinuclease ABC subunit UvrA [Paenibacillus tarimensis]MCF2945156.1 excinuclease ABC subunit UvrA [Paenibacillus tarimensis]
MEHIIVRNARIHHLKNLDIDIPKGHFVVFTGVSGSGKSSLAFDLLFEEGRKRYLNAIGLSAGDSVRENETFDQLHGLPPAIAVAQQTIRQTNPRSSVGTKTKAIDLLCRLYTLEGRDSDGNPNNLLGPEMFAYNRPEGMCPHCFGFGYRMEVDIKKLVPGTDWTLEKVCKNFGDLLTRQLPRFGESTGADWQATPYWELDAQHQHDFLQGVADAFEGAIPFLEARRDTSPISRALFERRFFSPIKCKCCSGFRITEQARNYTINGRHIGHLMLMTVHDLGIALREIADNCTLKPGSMLILQPLLAVCERMENMGLSYLSLVRSIPSLSGGELQRLFLMLHLQSDFDSLLYIFDEPTAGLHEAEKEGILRHIRALSQSGNSVIVVEHDDTVIRAADYVVELGPAAGKHGGQIVYAGTVNGLYDSPHSVTGPYLSGRRAYPARSARSPEPGHVLSIRNAALHNLKQVEADIPLGLMVGIAGKSGSGKSSLISGTLVPLLKYYFDLNQDEGEEEAAEREGQILDDVQGLGSLTGWEHLKKCVVVNQAPIGRTSMSTPATYVAVWDKLRKLFAALPQSASRDYTPSHFSFNTEQGACPHCKGHGTIPLDLGPLGSINQTCPECDGTRYKAEILEVKYNGYSIYDVLNAEVEEALSLFSDQKSIAKMLETLVKVGLGYLSLGQPAPTLSGGEAQRIKLARELGKAGKKGTLYVLDEPTNGLGPSDIEKLLLLLKELVDKGNTVVITEHKASVLAQCDWIIEMGPHGGAEGGQLIAAGSPEELADNPLSLIGPYLREPVTASN